MIWILTLAAALYLMGLIHSLFGFYQRRPVFMRLALAAGHTLHGRRVLATRSMHKNGDKLYVELSFSMVKDAQGAVIGAMAVARDITARYLKEKGQALSRDQSDGT